MNSDNWLDASMKKLMEQMESSHFVISLWSGKADAKIIFETGAAVLLDKKLIIVRCKGAAIPPSLARIAAEVVEGDNLEQAKPQIMAAINRMTGDLDKKEKARRARN